MRLLWQDVQPQVCIVSSCLAAGSTDCSSDSLIRHARLHARQTLVVAGDCPSAKSPDPPSLTTNSLETTSDNCRQSIDAIPSPSAAVSDYTPEDRNGHVEAQTTHASQIDRAAAASLEAHIAPQDMLPLELLGDLTSAVNPTGLPASIYNTPTAVDYRDIGLNVYDPSWLLGSNYDINALNISLSSALADWNEDLSQPQRSSMSQQIEDAADPSGQVLPISESIERRPTVQEGWHTHLGDKDDSQSQPAWPQTHDQVDDRYREGLSNRLQPQPIAPLLPSSGFLVSSESRIAVCTLTCELFQNLCIKLYFAKFNPVFPIIHAASFRPTSENALLLLSICSVGALFIGSPIAVTKGRQIFEILNKAVLASVSTPVVQCGIEVLIMIQWEKYLSRNGRETLALAQAAIIGQTFAMLSGQPQDLCMAESFHGTVISWARQGGFFAIKDSFSINSGQDNVPPEDAWRKWARDEESVRLVLGLYVHDSEFATTFHHDPLLRHSVQRLPTCCSEEIFCAPTAAQWQSVFAATQNSHSEGGVSMIHPACRSNMYPYASLAGIVASIQEAKAGTCSDDDILTFRNTLLAWYQSNSKQLEDPQSGPLNLLILWHAAFVALYAELDVFEVSIGRDGASQVEPATNTIRAWALSSRARRGLLHALFVLKHSETLSLGTEPAIHVPKALFSSILVVYCHVRFSPTADLFMPAQEEIDLPEIRLPSLTRAYDRNQLQAGAANLPPVDSSMLCNAIDLLRRIGHWELSRRFATTLENLLMELAEAD